jgi:uncharacterized phage-associated protein
MLQDFQEKKTTQLAAYLIKREGGQMNYMKLIKLLYIVDRTSLMKWGYPITGDEYFSLDHGPIVSKTLNLITDEFMFVASKYWQEYIEKDGWEVKLKQETPTGQLSEANIDIANEVYKEFGRLDQWQLRDITHKFKEWKDPKGSSIPIEYLDILCQNFPENEAKEIVNEIEEFNKISSKIEEIKKTSEISKREDISSLFF